VLQGTWHKAHLCTDVTCRLYSHIALKPERWTLLDPLNRAVYECICHPRAKKSNQELGISNHYLQMTDSTKPISAYRDRYQSSVEANPSKYKYQVLDILLRRIAFFVEVCKQAKQQKVEDSVENHRPKT
jgi:hypothetical protein